MLLTGCGFEENTPPDHGDTETEEDAPGEEVGKRGKKEDEK